MPLFFKKFIQNPRQTGSVWPSSRFLAEKMTENILDTHDEILELGAGTGVVTNVIINKFKGAVTVSEIDYEMRLYLGGRFHENKGITIVSCISEMAKKVEKYDAVISSLPLKVMRCDDKERVLKLAFSMLKKGGTFTQYTYGNTLAVDCDFLALNKMEVVQRKRVLLNIPPANVFICRKFS